MRVFEPISREKYARRVVLQVGRFSFPTDELGKSGETKKGTTPKHILEKVAHPCPA